MLPNCSIGRRTAWIAAAFCIAMFAYERALFAQVAICGDSLVTSPEQCDDGNDVNTDNCKNDCTLNVCGDGILFAGTEACDDGNSSDNDACKDDCTANVCGDGKLKIGVEACDDGNTLGSDGCSADCQTSAQTVCGDGIPEGNEQCDDGNLTDTDACKTNCQDNICGDNVLETGVEECDDGDTAGGDGCSSFCEDENPVCGDGHLDAEEQCDDGNAVSTDSCKNNCRFNVCSDGIVETGVEACDDGNSSDGDGCDSDCHLEGVPPVCGNDIVETGEECDDGNLLDDDGCDSDCGIEIAFCGNGVIDDGEACDDGLNDNEFCDDDCNIVVGEDGKVCFCHNSNNPHTICTSLQGFLNGHQKHGDTLGACEDDEEEATNVDGEVKFTGASAGCSLQNAEASSEGFIPALLLFVFALPLLIRKPNLRK